MPRSIVVRSSPEVLRWLRESSGWGIDEISGRLNTTPAVIRDLESGIRSPTLVQLEKMSASYRYPLAAFFLSKPKKQKPLPKDYRFLPGGGRGVFDKKTLIAIRRSRRLQNLGRELSSNIKIQTAPKVHRADLEDDTASIATKLREKIGLTLEKQIKFANAHKMFNHLRDVLGNANILVFQFPMPVEDARGFVLADESPAVITVNSKDTIEARLFTLMHELGHVLLGETAIDMPGIPTKTRNLTERWCDAFSSSFLLPAGIDEALLETPQPTHTETLDRLSKKYKVSKAALLYKMRDLGSISEAECNLVLARPISANKKKTESKKNNIVILPDKRCRSEIGNRFITLVADNFERDLITYMDALEYLSIQSRYFDKVTSGAIQ